MRYHQEKKQKNGTIIASCELELETNEDYITFIGKYSGVYVKKLKKYNEITTYKLSINKKTGDIINTLTDIKLDNDSVKSSSKKNDFNWVFLFTDIGFYRGYSSTIRYWGTNHAKNINEFFKKIKIELIDILSGTYLENKNYNEPIVNSLFDLIVDYHVTKKGIKAHNNIYNDIQTCYPKKKWLTLNNNKFLPSILDEYGIKSNYLVSELSTNSDKINVSNLIFLAKLFGDNHVDYMKSFNWKILTNDVEFKWDNVFECRDDSEKKCLVNVFNGTRTNGERVLRTIHELFVLRKYLEQKGCTDLKIKGKTFGDIKILVARWSISKKQANAGFKLKYTFPDEFVSEIEEPIVVYDLNDNDKTFIPKLLLTEEDFVIEGIVMNNCMGSQFSMGIICQFISLRLDKKRIDIQYKDGKIVQSFAKANTSVPLDIFGEAINELTARINNYKNIVAEKIKYDVTEY